ncbi:PREDICTED: CRIB domain-containing protein RIC11-like [Camelina sativa]|uniref:CRIB domain-containing protein RIC11-like n=1 Tax=Camelina sativa TaxID=90675 RepID=A0ABM0U0N9_CAMSA|nr:PREDICTED: CRIB domain-containing protein RIC11-like [Camelina sativa]
MAMKMKGIYKSFKSISQMFVVKERDIEIGYPTEVKHVAHIGWEGSSGSAPGWMSDFKAGEELLSPRASSFGHARHSNSFFTPSASSDFDEGSSQQTIPDRIRDIPPIPVGLSKIHTKSKNRRKKPSSTSSPRSKPSPKSSRSMGLSKSSHKSMISRLNSNA